MVAACYFWPGSEAASRASGRRSGTRTTETFRRTCGSATVLEWLQTEPGTRVRTSLLCTSASSTPRHIRARSIRPTIEARGAIARPVVGRVARRPREAAGQGPRVPAADIRSRDGGYLRCADRPSELAHRRRGGAVGYSGPVAGLYVTGGPAAARRLRDRINARLQHGRAYRREDLPERFRYRADPRGGDVVIVMDESWMVTNTAPVTGAIAFAGACTVGIPHWRRCRRCSSFPVQAFRAGADDSCR